MKNYEGENDWIRLKKKEKLHTTGGWRAIRNFGIVLQVRLREENARTALSFRYVWRSSRKPENIFTTFVAGTAKKRDVYTTFLPHSLNKWKM